jgi:SAM-dependent methyltransferase
MHQDIAELSAFYDRAMGVHVRDLIAAQIRQRWPNVMGMTVMGLGYATPYLEPFVGEAYRVGALMPAEQGARAWPTGGPIRSIVVDEEALPLPDASVDRMLAVHAIEMSDAVKRTLREIWRVLKPEGRALIVVPNRRSIWAHWDVTPFGEGQPFTKQQLEALISGGMFHIEACGFALATPPLQLAALWRYANTTEKFGLKLWPAISGAIILEATKQVSATIPKGKAQLVTGRLRPVAAVQANGSRAVAAAQSHAPRHQEHSLRAEQVLQHGRDAEAETLAGAVEGDAALDAGIDEVA